ncbi:hypothetical protein B597_022770 [Stutzerimonas stutzeri KOS6]|uniref:DUF5348 domain-containing protein n=2 Tax=Stutzerimonas stutzeri TaxID=316 RepID=A0A061JJ38_STUST|nr:hypothetical protein B597_022770 [Stutzerimonas stutzeri KOS6]
MLKPGVRYLLIDLDESIPGYLLDNIYYEDGHRCGELKDGTFYYNMIDGITGEPKYPDGRAGHLDGMEIIRVGDGLRFRLEPEDA